MAKKTFLTDIPEDIEEEIFFLYRIGVDINEIEYLINTKLKNLPN